MFLVEKLPSFKKKQIFIIKEEVFRRMSWAIVTGAGSGIGWHLAYDLCRSGANVLAIGRRVGPLKDLQDAVLKSSIDEPIRQFGRIQILQVIFEILCHWSRAKNTMLIKILRIFMAC